MFEVAKTGGRYAAAPTTLVRFNGDDGAYLDAGLIADAAGDLFGTASAGGASGDGTVFEIAKTGGRYASTPATLVSFNGDNGSEPAEAAGLIADAAGDLFGTTAVGGANNDGTVFEIAKTGGSYTLKTLVSFNLDDGAFPEAGLVADAAGDLFGTTQDGGGEAGTVFELVKIGGGYTLKTLASFNPAGIHGRRSDRGRRREPVRHDTVLRGGRRRHGVRGRQDRRPLRQHARHTRQLQRRQRGRAVCRSDRRRRR